MESVLILNASAIEFMRDGKTKEALCLLKRGMKTILKHAIDTPVDMASLGMECNTEKAVQSRLRAIQVMHIPDTRAVLSPDGLFMFFTKAFIVPHDLNSTTDCSGCCDSYRQLVCSVFLYNMGLTFHGIGLKTGSSQALEKALRFYEMAFLSINDEDKGRHLSLSEYNHILLAILNNMAHVSSHLFETQQVSECLDFLYYLAKRQQLSMENEDDAFFLETIHFALSWNAFTQAPAA